MDRDNNAADRVRPILKAMERSIERARSLRTHDAAPAAEGFTSSQPVRSPQPAPPVNPEEPAFDPTRLKARPKRSFHSQR